MISSPWLDHPAVQGGVAPLLAGLIVGLLLIRTRFAWIAVVVGYLVMLTLSGDLAFEPLTASRKVVLAGLGAAGAGIAIDAIRPPYRWLPAILSAAAALAAAWVFVSVLRQREGAAFVGAMSGVALFAGALTAAVLRLRDDGIRAGAAGLGLGLAVGIAGILSASIGYLLGGVAVAASSGALLLIQVVARQNLAPGYTGALTIGVLTSYFAAATFLLASLPWFALPLFILVPLAASLRLPETWSQFARAAVASAYVLGAAVLPILAAWYAARGLFT